MVDLDYDRLTAELDGIRRAAGVPGIAVEVSIGDRHLSICTGTTAVDNGETLTRESKFTTLCLIKFLVSLLALDLAHKKVIELDDPLQRHIPEVACSSKGHAIKLSYLLSLSAGYKGLHIDDVSEWLAWGERECIEYFNRTPMLFRPGTVVNEDHLGHALLGCAIERTTGKSVGTLLRENLFEPLGITTSTVHRDVEAGIAVAGYQFNNQRALTEFRQTAHVGPAISSSLSRMTMSVSDLAAILRSINGGSSGQFSFKEIGAALDKEVVAVPGTVGARQDPAWTPKAFSTGCAHFGNGMKGYLAVGAGQSWAVLTNISRSISIVVAMNVGSPVVRNHVVRLICSHIDQTVPPRLGEEFGPEAYGMDFPTFTSPFGAEDLNGTYAGNQAGAVSVTASPGLIVVRNDRFSLTILEVQRKRMAIDTKTPIPIAFFAEPSSGAPGLMLGLSAYRKVA